MHYAVSVFAGCFLLAACDAQMGTSSPTTEAVPQISPQPGESHIYWTALDETGKTVIRKAAITPGEKEALLAARGQNRQMAAAGAEDSAGKTAHIKATIGSQDWGNCMYYNWVLFTSGYNNSGDFFCALNDGSYYGPYIIQMPFIPLWYDASTSQNTLLCYNTTSTSECYYYDCAWGPKSWQFIWSSQGSGNLSPPAGIQSASVEAGAVRGPC